MTSTATNDVIRKTHSLGTVGQVKSSADDNARHLKPKEEETMLRLSQLLHRRVPSLPPADWERQTPTSAALRRDIFSALGFFVLALLMQELVLSMTEAGKSADRPLAFALLAALILPLMFRRRWPITMMLIGSAAFLIGGSTATATVAMQFCAQLRLFLRPLHGGRLGAQPPRAVDRNGLSSAEHGGVAGHFFLRQRFIRGH